MFQRPIVSDVILEVSQNNSLRSVVKTMSNVKITDFFQEIKQKKSTIQIELENETLHSKFYKQCFERQNEACFDEKCTKKNPNCQHEQKT